MLRRVLLFLIVLSTAISVTAQTGILSQKITLKVKKQSMSEIFKLIETQAKVAISYNSKILPKGKYPLTLIRCYFRNTSINNYSPVIYHTILNYVFKKNIL